MKETRNDYNVSLIKSDATKWEYDQYENWSRTREENLFWEAYNAFQKKVIVRKGEDEEVAELMMFGDVLEFTQTLCSTIWGVVETPDGKHYVGELFEHPESSNIALKYPIQISGTVTMREAAEFLDCRFHIGYLTTNMKRIVSADDGEVLAKEDKLGYFKLRY